MAENSRKIDENRAKKPKIRLANWSFNARRAGLQKYYDKIKANFGGECALCNLTKWHNNIIYETRDFLIIKNHFPYFVYESHRVEEHFLLIPKKHRTSIGEFNSEEREEFAKTVGDYESRGFQISAHAPATELRTEIHQHTHLIKVKRKKYVK